MNRDWAVVGILSAALLFSGACAAAEPLGVYVGAAGGQATVRVHAGIFDLDRHDTGWKVLLGVRPLPFIGAELEYTDFGQPSAVNRGVCCEFDLQARQQATSAFAVGYLPLGHFDLYAKAGVSRLHTTYSERFQCFAPFATCIRAPDPIAQGTSTDNHFGYGAGGQFRMGLWSIRAEYERIRASTGDPQLLSLGVSLNF